MILNKINFVNLISEFLLLKERPKNEIIYNPYVELAEGGTITVKDEHPEVVEAVKKALEDAENQNVTLPAQVYAEVLQENIKIVQMERLKIEPKGPA